MSFVLQLQAVIQNCLGAHRHLPELLHEKNSLVQRMDSGKNCSDGLWLQIDKDLSVGALMSFQTEYRCSLCVSYRRYGIEQHHTSMHMNIDPCMSKVKVDMKWETNSIEHTAVLSGPLFPYLFDNSEPSSPCNI